jgi:hypothetical protein
MFKWLFFLSISSLLIACSLNSEQERQLNKSFSNYLNARNSGSILEYTSLIYPELIRDWKTSGVDTLKEKVKLKTDTTELKQYDNPFIILTKKENKSIQIKYQLDCYQNEYTSSEKTKVNLYAISDDEGKSWFFMDEKDYINPQTCKKLKRLIQ